MRKTEIRITDDLDGTPGATTRTFGYRGRHYEIDLTDANASTLDSLLAPYVGVARPVANGNGKTSGGDGHPRRDPHAKAKRLWWQNNPDGLPTWQRVGAIPATVTQAWERRHDTGNNTPADTAPPAAEAPAAPPQPRKAPAKKTTPAKRAPRTAAARA